MTVSGCDMELNAHFGSAASLKYHAPDTWHDTTASHIMHQSMFSPRGGVVGLPSRIRIFWKFEV